jgi:hypothetical protein
MVSDFLVASVKSEKWRMMIKIRNSYRPLPRPQGQFGDPCAGPPALARLKKNCSHDLAEVAMGQATSWTAVAERSGDTAFARTTSRDSRGPHESGVALRFPAAVQDIIGLASLLANDGHGFC